MSTTITSMTANITAALQFSSGAGASTSTSASSTAAASTAAATALAASNPAAKLLDAQISRDSAKLSSIGQIALALDNFKSVASSLSSGGATLGASVSGAAATAQVTGSSAAAGTYAVDVKQLATGQQLLSPTVSDKTAALGTGAATLIKIQTGSGAGASTTTVRVDSPDNTLDGIAKALNDAGVDAEVKPSGKGYALSLTGATGAANAMTVSVSGDAALKSLLTYTPSASGASTSAGKSGMTQAVAAQDALGTVDGKAVTSASNKLSGAVAGVALTLAATGKSTVTVSGDSASIAANVKSFVSAFNTLNTQLGSLKSANSDTTSTVNAVLTQMATALSGTDKNTLAAMGITRKNGSLVLDETKLTAAIGADPASVASTFSNGGTGLADRLGKQVSQQMASGGLLARQSAAVEQDMDKLSAQKTKVSATLSRQASLLAQQYGSTGTGSSSLFGMLGGSSTASLFDFLA